MSKSPTTTRIRDRPNDDEDVIDVDGGNNNTNNAAKKEAQKEQEKKPTNSANSKVAAFFNLKKPATAAVPPQQENQNQNNNNNNNDNNAVNLRQYVTDPEWSAALKTAFDSPYMRDIERLLLKEEQAGKQVFPPRNQIFSALNVCPLSKVKVVLIGQDPYHDNGQAHGMCFSVMPGIKVPPSLVNMYKELEKDIPGFEIPKHGYLMHWAQQGILLLNATLTVQAHQANSHEKCGWQKFTDAVIDIVNKRKEPAVFLLWGNFAIKKAKRVDRNKHKVIENAHPSPLSAYRWWGCKPYSKCNDALKELKYDAIDWNLPLQVKAE